MDSRSLATPDLEQLDADAVAFLTDARAQHEPWDFFRRLRSEAPVFRTSLGVWLVSRYDDCMSLLREPVWSMAQAARQVAPLAFEEGYATDLYLARVGTTDDPVHTRLRTLLARSFTPAGIARWKPLVDSVVTDLLDAVAERHQMDLMHEFALPLPQRVLSELLGVPYADRDLFLRWSLTLVNRRMGGATDDAERRRLTVAMEEFAAYLEDLVDERRRAPRDDLLSELIQAREADDRLAPIELIAILTELITGGQETTSNVIGNGVVLLLRNPAQLDRVRQDPALLPQAVEEILRLEPATHHSHPRVATEGVELGGATIPRGERAIALLSSANRDDDIFPEPDTFDVARSRNRHLAFSFGAHFCLGAALARVEVIAALGTLLERCPALALVNGTVDWKNHHRLHGPATLPVRW